MLSSLRIVWIVSKAGEQTLCIIACQCPVFKLFLPFIVGLKLEGALVGKDKVVEGV